MIALDLRGSKGLERKLNSLDRKVSRKVVRAAVRDAQKITLKAAKENAAGMVGGEMGAKLKKALNIRAFKKRKKGSYGMKIGLKLNDAFIHHSIGKQAGGNRYFIPFAIEYGHAAPGAGGSGAKDVPAIPFMRNAADRTAKQKRDFFTRRVWTGILNAMRGK